jgi:hypothetical protein
VEHLCHYRVNSRMQWSVLIVVLHIFYRLMQFGINIAIDLARDSLINA